MEGAELSGWGVCAHGGGYNEKSGVCSANAPLRVTSCSRFSQSVQSKPQAPPRSF